MTYQAIRKEFENYIQKEQFDTSVYPLYKAVNYIMGSEAKRFRPALLLMSFSLYNNEIHKALPAAIAIELFHNFTLIHDDIMDEASIRRGQPSVHKKFGINQAILSGDAMMMLSYKYLLKATSEYNTKAVVETITRMAVEVCEGQDLDMAFETREVVGVEEYLKMIELKTAVLLAASLKVGGLLGGAEPEDAENLFEFGRNMGIAFQIQDDILDAFGSSSKVGKRIGGDIYQKKKTYLFTKALEMLSKDDQKDLLYYYQSSEDMTSQDVDEVKGIFLRKEVLNQARIEQEKYYQIAMSHLNSVKLEDEKKEPLRNVARMLFERQH
jgi:geranylgeranyl diphosphate synthase type II